MDREEYSPNINELAVDYILHYSDLDTSYSFYRLELQNNPQVDFLSTNCIIHIAHPNYLYFRVITQRLDSEQFSGKLISYIRQKSQYIIDIVVRFQDLTNDVNILLI